MDGFKEQISQTLHSTIFKLPLVETMELAEQDNSFTFYYI